MDKSHIAEIKVYNNPPKAVETVMKAVCLLLRIPTSWKDAKLALADSLFIKRLILIDRDSIPSRVFVKLREVTSNDSFVPEKIAKVNTFVLL